MSDLIVDGLNAAAMFFKLDSGQAPNASFGSVIDGLEVTFTDTSTSPNGSIIAWAWSFGDGGRSTAQNPVHTYAAGGDYTVSLVITDEADEIAGASDDVTAVAVTTKLVAILGQSNAPGRGDIDDVTILGSWSSAYPAVQIRQYEGDNASNPPPEMYDTVGDLQPRSDAGDNMGIELSLGRYLDAESPDRWYIVKYGIGGTGLEDHWMTDANYPNGQPPNLCELAIAYIQAAEVEFDAPIGAIIWIQGEADAASAGDAALYEANLTTLIARWRQVWPDVPVLFNRLNNANQGTEKATIRTAQAAVGSAVAGTTMIDVDGLALADGQHYFADGYIEMGQLFAPHVLVACGLDAKPTANFSFTARARAVDFFDGSTAYDGTIATYAWDFGDSTTASTEDPSHTYSADGSFTVSLTITDSNGLQRTTSQTVTVVQTATWTVDATSGVAWPSSAAEWTAFQAAHSLTAGGAAAGNPAHLYNAQEAAGAMVDQIGGKNLSITNAPTRQKAVPGWTRTAIGGSGAATTQSASNNTVADISTSPVLALAYLRFTPTTSDRRMVSSGGTSVNELQMNGSTQLIRKLSTGGNAIGVRDHATGAPVRPYLISASNDDELDQILSDIERLSVPWTSAAGTLVALQFSLATDVAMTCDLLGLAIFRGTAARRTVAERKHLLHALGWRTTGYDP